MKKQDALSVEKTIEFAKPYYQHKTTFSGGDLLEHCIAVARQAEVIAAKLYQDVRKDFCPDSTKESIAAIMHGSVLHDVLRVGGCAFEQIAENTTVQVAAMVADVTRDFRLVETKRDMDYRGRLSQSPVSSQILATADVICTAKEALNFLAVSGLDAVSKSKKVLAQLDGDLLAVHAASRYYVLRLYVHAARNMLLDVSTKIKECRHNAKLVRLANQNTKSLQERVAKKSRVAAKRKDLRNDTQ